MSTDLEKLKCRHVKRCPGCPQIQFVYAKQLFHKQRVLQEMLGSVAEKLQIKIDPVEKSPLRAGYRTTSKLALHEDNFGRRSIGIYERASKDVVDIPDCPVHAAEINKLVEAIFRAPGQPPFPFYQHGKKSFQPGRLKFVTVRMGANRTAAMIISHTGVDTNTLGAWVAGRIPPAWKQSLSVWSCALSERDKDLVLSDRLDHLLGPKTISFQLGASPLTLHPGAFFQANGSLIEPFIEKICSGLKGDYLLDLYGGFGAYALTLAGQFKQVSLVDGNESAVAAARLAAEERGYKHLTASAKYCEAFLKAMPKAEKAKVTTIIVNPPRGGLSPDVRHALTRQQFPKLETITYVSCNPETLARDLGAIVRQGAVTGVFMTPFDMFPQTNHVETVARVHLS